MQSQLVNAYTSINKQLHHNILTVYYMTILNNVLTTEVQTYKQNPSNKLQIVIIDKYIINEIIPKPIVKKVSPIEQLFNKLSFITNIGKYCASNQYEYKFRLQLLNKSIYNTFETNKKMIENIQYNTNSMKTFNYVRDTFNYGY